MFLSSDPSAVTELVPGRCFSGNGRILSPKNVAVLEPNVSSAKLGHLSINTASVLITVLITAVHNAYRAAPNTNLCWNHSTWRAAMQNNSFVRSKIDVDRRDAPLPESASIGRLDLCGHSCGGFHGPLAGICGSPSYGSPCVAEGVPNSAHRACVASPRNRGGRQRRCPPGILVYAVFAMAAWLLR